MSNRQQRLLGCACTRRHIGLAPDWEGWYYVEMAEAYADDNSLELDSREAARFTSVCGFLPWIMGQYDKVWAKQYLKGGEAELELIKNDIFFEHELTPEDLNQKWLLWNEGAVRKIAETIYVENRFYDVSILGDALEEAGCDNETILDHAREYPFHVRGCWLLDLLLGKER